MEYQYYLIAFGILIANIITTLLILKWNSQAELNSLKKSNLSININKIKNEFVNHIKIEYLKDRKIKIIFPSFVLDKELHFYMYDTLDGNIILTDFGEMISVLNTTRTPNKSAIKKVCDLVGVKYDGSDNAIRLQCTTDKLDESLWTMFAALMVIEYVRY